VSCSEHLLCHLRGRANKDLLVDGLWVEQGLGLSEGERRARAGLGRSHWSQSRKEVGRLRDEVFAGEMNMVWADC
jgi:hypothetical protein